MKIVTVKFATDSKIVDFKSDGDALYELSDQVLVNNAQILEVGHVINIYEAEKLKNIEGEGKISKKIDEDDRRKLIELKKKAIEYVPKCLEIVGIYGLPMNIIDADLSFDEKKLTLYFASDSRIDFRKLVSHFVRTFKKLIRLQQIGPREQAQKMGGYGKCGEEICCKRFLHQLENVSIDLAKNQNLAEVSGNKINGNCGKLLCCLKYENEEYIKIKKNMPEIGTELNTKKGKARVIKQNVPSNSIIVELCNDQRERVEVKL